MVKQFYGYKKFNEASLKHILTNPEEVKEVQVGVNVNSDDLREKFNYHVADYVSDKMTIEIDTR